MTSGSKENSEDQENGALLFAWRQKKPVFLYLGIFGAASLVVHLLGFYLFQVVYPASGRLEPEPYRVTLLNDSQASVNALLRKVEDRLVYLRPASAGSDIRVSLGDYSAQFQPSFSDRQVGFKSDPPIAAVRRRQPGRIADPLAPANHRHLELFLPPVTIPEGEAVQESAVAESRWRISGDLEARSLREAEDFSGSLPPLGTPPAIRLRIGVGSNGAVRSYVPVAGQSHPRIGEVLDAVRSHLRFEPKPGTELEWGWLDISR